MSAVECQQHGGHYAYVYLTFYVNVHFDETAEGYFYIHIDITFTKIKANPRSEWPKVGQDENSYYVLRILINDENKISE